MTNYFDKEDVNNIEIINTGLGMKHRSKPFDFAKPSDLNEAFKYAVCAFSDYCSYAMELDKGTI